MIKVDSGKYIGNNQGVGTISNNAINNSVKDDSILILNDNELTPIGNIILYYFSNYGSDSYDNKTSFVKNLNIDNQTNANILYRLYRYYCDTFLSFNPNKTIDNIFEWLVDPYPVTFPVCSSHNNANIAPLNYNTHRVCQSFKGLHNGYSIRNGGVIRDKFELVVGLIYIKDVKKYFRDFMHSGFLDLDNIVIYLDANRANSLKINIIDELNYYLKYKSVLYNIRSLYPANNLLDKIEFKEFDSLDHLIFKINDNDIIPKSFSKRNVFINELLVSNEKSLESIKQDLLMEICNQEA